MNNLIPIGMPLPAPPASRPAAAGTSAEPVTALELQAQLERVLASPCFAKAWRSSHLLRYLVGAVAAPSLRLVNEYVIGIDVFRRDPATYSTGEDPIVRVQLGRLRTRLDDYYGGAGKADPVRIRLHLGSYLPHVERSAAPAPSAPMRLLLAFPTLAGVQHEAVGWFIAGLHDELRHRLHHQLGACFLGPVRPHADGDAVAQPEASHVLECSVRTDGSCVRNSLRLLDVATGCIAWSRQVDHGMALSIACQEQLATLCCAAVEECALASR